jgi:hypothetical protein
MKDLLFKKQRCKFMQASAPGQPFMRELRELRVTSLDRIFQVSQKTFIPLETVRELINQ